MTHDRIQFPTAGTRCLLSSLPRVSTALSKKDANTIKTIKTDHLQRFTPSPSHFRFLFVQKSQDSRSRRPGTFVVAVGAVFALAAVGKLLLSRRASKLGSCCVDIPAKAPKP